MLLKLNGFPISAGFGDIDSVHKIPHKGVDLAMPEGTPLHAIADGVVSRINDEGAMSFGKSVRIELDDGTEVIYGHLSAVKAHVGEHVHAGDVIALSGNTGHSTGPHLHLQMVSDNGALIDPTSVVQAVADPKGFMDYVNDFSDWFIDKEAEYIVKPVSNTFMDWIHHAVAILNANSAEIITLGIIVCGAGMMVGPMIGGGSKWFGRLFAVFFGGTIWRVLT